MKPSHLPATAASATAASAAAASPSAPRAARAWMRLPSGQRLDLMNPSPGAWRDADLATRLARTYRWGGESSWPLPLSVAQHSLTVLALRRNGSTQPLTPEAQLRELLHDAEEGFLGFDCISPLKAALGQPFKDVEGRLVQAIAIRYRLGPWAEADYTLHKRADIEAAAAEAVHCVGWTPAEVRDVLGIDAAIRMDDPLAELYGGTPWEPWPADMAAGRFLAELTSLVDTSAN